MIITNHRRSVPRSPEGEWWELADASRDNQCYYYSESDPTSLIHVPISWSFSWIDEGSRRYSGGPAPSVLCVSPADPQTRLLV